ncbi:hypothetical protein BS50DRAFT_87193 [Corynespora cassiicola Philippines]|uniref:Uncharacterized protein n=1 Tax=Corynespora cassiicola Philippines TaxID=1448308 RepID=A0A2T2NE48_CORCC|nr:hypothetical protein BS50DRAFT_87193 [Corynespora cassiicola Philippines]
MPCQMFSPVVSTAILALLLVLNAVTLEVAPDSSCANFCLDSPQSNASNIYHLSTFDRDISCLGTDYSGANSTEKGRRFKSRVGCEQTSDWAWGGDGDDGENDVYWFLYKLNVNIKSTIAWCVTGFFESQSNPNVTKANTLCSADCEPISKAINDRLKQSNQRLQYNYCSSDNDGFMNGIDKCATCLSKGENLQILANFESTLIFNARLAKLTL